MTSDEDGRRTLEFDRRDDLHNHDGLQDDRSHAEVVFTEGCDGADAEGQFGRIDRVVRTVLQDEATARDGTATQVTLLKRIVEALQRINSRIAKEVMHRW